MKLKLRKFDITKIAHDATIMLVGKRRTGKSTLVRDIMRHMAKRLDFGIAMCGSEDTGKAMAEFIPPSCIYDEYSAEALDVLLKYQKRCLIQEKCKKVYLIMDDTMYDKSTLKSKNMRLLFMNGRHRQIFFLCAVQYLMDIPPDLRTNVDYLFVLKENVLTNKEKLWKHFFGMFSDYKDFNVVMNACTTGFGCLVLDNTARSNNPADCVFWYQADPAGCEFNVGTDGVWALHNKFGIQGGVHHPGGAGGGGPGGAGGPDENNDDDACLLEDDDGSCGKSMVGVAEQLIARKKATPDAGQLAMAMLLEQHAQNIHSVERCD